MSISTVPENQTTGRQQAHIVAHRPYSNRLPYRWTDVDFDVNRDMVTRGARHRRAGSGGPPQEATIVEPSDGLVTAAGYPPPRGDRLRLFPAGVEGSSGLRRRIRS